MKKIVYSNITDIEEIEILRDRVSFEYSFDQDTIDLLKKNFTLKDSLYILAKSDDDFVAFCSVDRDWWEGNHFFIREILVDQKFQKQNIGMEIMNRCIEHAKKNGAKGIVTETAFENISMQRLCEKLGFKKWDNPTWKEGLTYKIIF